MLDYTTVIKTENEKPVLLKSVFCEPEKIYKTAFSCARYCKRYFVNANILVYRNNKFIYGFFVKDYFGINDYLIRFYLKDKSSFLL